MFGEQWNWKIFFREDASWFRVRSKSRQRLHPLLKTKTHNLKCKFLFVIIEIVFKCLNCKPCFCLYIFSLHNWHLLFGFLILKSVVWIFFQISKFNFLKFQMFLPEGKLLRGQLTPLQKLSDVSEVLCLPTPPLPIFENQLLHYFCLFILFFFIIINMWTCYH